MKRPKVKKVFAAPTVISLALAASLAYGLMSGRSASAKSEHNPSNKSGISGISGASASAAASSSAMSAAAQTTGITMLRTPIYALSTNNTIYALWPGATSFTRLVRVTQANGNLIGIDFRPAAGNNNALYALTDTGSIYTVNLTAAGLGAVTKVSDLTTRFPSGVQSLLDFNPVLDAIRLIGSDRSNYAVVNSGGNLNAMAIQTPLSYDPNDVNKGVSPHVSTGAYTNNVVGATTTLFYAIDYDLDTFLTIQPATPGGSSATGGGVLQTLGPLVTPVGQRVNISSTADIDIYTNNAGVNRLVGVSGQTFFNIDLSLVNPAAPAGSVTNIVTQGITMPDDGNDIIDIAAAPTSYEAENATQGGGNIVQANFPGFSGTGFVNYADNVAGGFTQFQVNQSGTQTLIFRYSNGGTVNRPCNVTVNGVSVGTVAFAPTGSFGAYKTTTLPVNLGTAVGFRAVRITSTTAAGGPNLDKMDVQ
jgi:Domain of unknown function (DUF4394)